MVNVFRKMTKTNKEIFITIISPLGVKEGIYVEELVDSVVTLEDLFKPI